MPELEKIRHSLAHILAMTVKRIWPEAKLGIGPATEDGFYYDFDLKAKISSEDLPRIEKEMQKLIRENISFKQEFIDFEEGERLFTSEPYKLELIKELKESGEKRLSIYRSANFVDLCKGPHVKNTRQLTPFKIIKIAGAYWRGDETQPMLQRIYGVAFATQAELNNYLALLSEAQKRDHRKLGTNLDLFIFSEEVGPGLPLYTPLGARLREKIVDFSKELRREIGYEEVFTPHITKAVLFETSGHLEKYKENMFKVVSNYSSSDYYLKPMNCPMHTQIYASKLRSYKDLPLRLADFSVLYRDEKTGELNGLSRLRAFSQDDGHSFCREDQLEEEFARLLLVIKRAMETYGLSYSMRLSLRDPNESKNYLGDASIWERAEKLLKSLVKEQRIDFEERVGEAAFYGPKIDLLAKDSLGRSWQLSTVQLDFNMPKRFGLKYIDEEGKPQTPVMIHSAIVGSPERLIAILIEHYAGAFPLWLAPIEAAVLPVSEKFLGYAEKIARRLTEERIAILFLNEDSLSKRILEAEKKKIPVVAVVGEKEEKDSLVSLRVRGEKKLQVLPLEEFIGKVKEAVKRRLLKI